MPLSSGTRLGFYEIIAPLGQGGMGEVYHAHDPRLNRRVAVKVLPERLSSDSDARERLRREAMAAASLEHPFICKVLEIGEDGGVLFMVMEYVAGETLHHRLCSGPLTANEALRMAGEVAEALEAAHNHGFVHRDLKPANVMLTPDGHVKVMDFGLAKRAARVLGQESATMTVAATPLTGWGTVVGTPDYMSPEQVRGEPLDQRSDLFSFGILLCELLTHSNPFRRGSATETMAAILRDPPNFAGDLPPGFMAPVRRLLEKSPEERYPSMAEVRADLRQLASGTAVAAAPTIAVLPFDNLSADKENEYFSDGLAEEILSALTRVKGLRVIARASAFAFRGHKHDLAEIARRLKVTVVLDGSVRKAGNRIRVAAQLIRIEDESQLWSERYDRELIDVFAVQDEIAQAVVDALKGQFHGGIKRTMPVQAYDCLLRGRFLTQKLTPGSFDRAIELFQRAIEIDPGCAAAYAEMGTSYQSLGFHGARSPRELNSLAKASLERAMALDEGLAEAHAYLGRHLGLFEYRWKDAERHFRRALELGLSSAWPFFYYGCEYMTCTGRSSEGMPILERALELDPLNPWGYYGLAVLTFMVGQSDRAILHFSRALDVDPGFWVSHQWIGNIQLQMGRVEEGVASLEKAAAMAPPDSAPALNLVCAWQVHGREMEAQQRKEKILQRRQTRYVSSTAIACMELSFHQLERALEWLETAYEDRDPLLPFVAAGVVSWPAAAVDQQLLRSHPKWIALLGKLGIAGR